MREHVGLGRKLGPVERVIVMLWLLDGSEEAEYTD